MAWEIERKFLLRNDNWRTSVTAIRDIRQGYLALDDTTVVRVRIDQDKAWITVKAQAQEGRRPEFEYEVPRDDARMMMALCRGRVVHKRRHVVPVGAHIWEVDVFTGKCEGLQIAEIELRDPDEVFTRPKWLGEEVTGDRRYDNSALAMR